MPGIDCFTGIRIEGLEDKFKSLVHDGMTEAEQRAIGTKLALEEHQKLYDKLQDFKKSVNPKHVKEKYVAPDNSEAVKKINDSYNPKIEALKSAQNEETKAAEIPKPETQTGTSDGGTNPPVEPTGEGKGGGEDWTAIRKEKQREIKAVQDAYEKQGVKAWSETMRAGLEKTQKAFPTKSLYDGALTLMHNIKAGLGHGELTTDEALATMQYLKRELGAKRAELSEAVTSDNMLEREAALMQDEGLEKDYVNAALAIKDITTTAGRTLSYAQSELRLDPEHGLQIRRMQMLRSNNGQKLSPEQMKWTEERWAEEKEVMEQIAAVREQSMKEHFDNKIADLQKEYDEKLKNAGKGTTPSKTAREKSLSQKGKSVADKIRQLKKPKGSTNVDFTFGTWDLAVEGIAKLVEAGSTIAEAIEKLVKDGTIGFKEQKDREDFENHIVESIPEQKDKSEILNDIKEFADENKVTGITNEMVGKGLIRDYVNSHIGETEQGSILDVAAKDLKEILPDASKEKLIEAYLKENEFKQPTKKDVEGGLAEAKKQLNNIAKLTEDIEDLEGLKKIRQRSFPTEREKSQVEQELINEKAAKIKEVKERREKILADNKTVQDEAIRQGKKVQELKDKKAKLEQGIIEKTTARQKAVDTPEIEKLKSEISKIEKDIRQAEVTRKAIERKIKSDRDNQIKKDNARIESETIRQGKKVQDLKKKLAILEAGVKPNSNPKERSVDTPEIESLKQQIKDAEKVISERKSSIKSDNSKLEAEAIRQVTKVQELQDRKDKLEHGIREKRVGQPKIDTPEIEAAKAQVKAVDKALHEAESLAKKMDRDIQNKKDKLDEMDAGIKRAENGLNQIKIHRNKTEPQIDEEIEAKKKELKKAILSNATDEQQQAKKLALEKENTIRKIEEFKRKLAEGEFEEPTPIKLRKQDAELIRLKKQQSIIEEAYRKKQKEFQEKNKSRIERAADFARSGYVGLLIGSPKTLLKVVWMSLMRPILEASSKLTFGKAFDAFLPNISQAALRGGESSSISSMQKGFEAYFRQMDAQKLESIYDRASNMYESARQEYNDYKNSANPDAKKLIILQDNMNAKLIKAQGSFIYKFIGGRSLKDALKSLVNRSNEIERQFGKVEGESIKDGNWADKLNYIIGFIGRSHSAAKTFSGRFSFAAGFMARLEGAVRDGRDISNGDTILEVAHESYLDWERGKYQQSNQITDLWNKMTNHISEGEQGTPREGTSKIMAALLKTEVAITRVPVNILHEAIMEYTFGAFIALGKVAKTNIDVRRQLKSEGILSDNPEFKKAIKERIASMDEKQAASIVRAFRKGGLGAGLYAFALISGLIHFGIFPHLGQKKKKDESQLAPDELNPGQVMVGDTKLGEVTSGIIEHIPAFYPAFMGLGMAQSYKDAINNGKTTAEGVEDAVFTHLKIIEGGIPQTKIISPSSVIKTVGQTLNKKANDLGLIDTSTDLLPKDVQEKDDFKALKEKGIKMPHLGTIKQHKIDVDDAHPNGLMKPDEFKQFNEYRREYIEAEIPKMLNKKWNVYEEAPNGRTVSDKNVLGKDLDKKELEGRVRGIVDKASDEAKKKLGFSKEKNTVTVEEQ